MRWEGGEERMVRGGEEGREGEGIGGWRVSK